MEIRNKAAAWACLIVVIVLAYVTIFLIMKFPEWKRELKYINMELLRAEGGERRHWKRCKKRLLLSILPFVKIKKR